MSSAPASRPDRTPALKPGTQFVARQTILTADEKVFGYELLFRDGIENFFHHGDQDEASRSTLNTSTLIGLDVLCDGHHAFLNCTRDTLLKDYLTLLPPGRVVAEILETMTADSQVETACRRLKERGYLIALDDFVLNDAREPLVELADIIKVDVRMTPMKDAAAMVKQYEPYCCRMLAEKVEGRDEFVAAKEAGFQLFQGYFFRRPEVLTTHEIPANRMNYLRMLAAVSQSELNLREIESLLKSEAALCYRLLRYLNSAAFGFGAEIRSVHHAISILGERELRRWIRLVAMLGAGQQCTTGLVLSTLVRARFCELLSPKFQHGESDLFLLGMLSLMDSILEIPMRQVLESVRIDQESRKVLLGEDSRLRPFYRLMLAQESGEWQAISELARQLKIPEIDIADAHMQAMQWAWEVSSGK